MKKLEPFAPYAYAVMRITHGLFFSFHGVQKIFGLFTEWKPVVGSQLWIGGMIELAGGLAIALGVKTRWAAFLCSGMMAVAYVQFHWKLQMGRKFLPGLNEGEHALMYAFVFLYIACRGGGKWSLGKD
ncbi:MAG: DoxX family protein [Elusimicrobia bacterium]|nr:DoxX family protein [Elusimicrobiota bacterium]